MAETEKRFGEKLSRLTLMIATEHRKCSDELAVARSERDTCNQQKQGHELTIQKLESEKADLKNQRETAQKQYENATRELNALKKEDRCSSQKTALGVVSPIAVLLLISTVGLIVWIIRLKTHGGIE